MAAPVAEFVIRIDLSDLFGIRDSLARIERALNLEGEIMSELDDKLTAVTSAVADLAADVDRELADLRNALSGTLSADQEAAFQALSDKIAGIRSAVDTADPAPVPPAAPVEEPVPAAEPAPVAGGTTEAPAAQ